MGTTDVLLSLNLLTLSGMAYMARKYFDRSERHFSEMHRLMSVVKVHDFVLAQLYEEHYKRPYPFGMDKEKEGL